MSAGCEKSRFSESTEHWEMDDRQRVKEVIKKKIRGCGASLEEVKVAVVEEIERCRNSTSVENCVSEENIFRRILKFNVLQNIYKTVAPNANEEIQQQGENVTEVSLSSTDHAYIDQKYVKYCSEFWLQEAVAHSTEMIKHQDRNTIQHLLYSIGPIQCLSEIPGPFNELKYYKLLEANYGLIGRADEKTCVDKFKKEIFQLIIVYSHSVKNEVNFYRVFMDFLFAFKNLEDIETKLRLQTFCYGDSTFDELLDRIINLDVNAHGTELKALHQEAKLLKQEKELFAADKFKEIVTACLKPVEIQETRSDGRIIIETTGRCIVMSKILDQLEAKLRFNPAVEEVRIIGADILHVDADIKEEIWRGVNIVIFVDKIKIHNKIVWDVSGKDSDHVYPDNAGTGEDGHGKQGADGHAGESGGNVLIQANEVEDPENFTIISHGGRGGSGQDGGNGKDGPDGRGIQPFEFLAKFPSVVKLFASAPERTNLLMKTVENIRGSGIVSCDWCRDSNRFIEATTLNDETITFSFCDSSFNTRFQAFLLYRGSRGQAGGPGGDYGLGGDGGCNGEIITSEPNIVVLADQGAKGANGKGGWYGRHGKNGWDMGYTHYQTWRFSQFYGLAGNSKLRLEYHDTWSASEKQVWCPYQDRYVEITCCRIEHRIERNCQERKNCPKNGERQRETQVTKKKTISRTKTSADYAHHFATSGRGYIENLQSSLQNINQHASQAMTKSAEQQEKVTTELNVKRHISSSRLAAPCRKIIKPVSTRQTAEQSFDIVTCELENDSLYDYLLRLKSSELDRFELDELFIKLDSFEKSLVENQELKGNTENCELHDIKQILNEKYRFAVLQDIAKQLPRYQNARVNSNLTPTEAAKYLRVAVNESETNISHPELGTLDQYLFQNSKRPLGNIFRFLKKKSTKSAKEAFERSVGTFVSRVGDAEQTHRCVGKYYREYKEHSEKQNHSLQIFLTPFLSELQRQPHVFALWAESNKDKAIKFELMTEIRKCRFLNALYNRVDKQLKLVYNWDKCCRDKNLRKEYDRHIREKGPFSGSYRQLLAIVFNINIRLYTEGQENRFCLLDNHNPGSKRVVYILQSDDKLSLLNIGDDLLKLDEERKNNDNLYTKILSETESFKQKEQFDDYSLNNKFLSSDDTLDIEYSFQKESDVINIREDYFSSSTEERQMIECLEKIAPQFIGHKSILRYILERFSIDGTHVSLEELYCLVNSILASVIDDNADLDTFCWIVAAYPQRCWLSELVLQQIENHFKTRITDKSKWREYMLKIENKDILMSLRLKLNQFKLSGRISIQCIEKALVLLSKIPNATINLEELDLPEWAYALKGKYWTHRLSQLANWRENEKLSEASYYLLSAENTFGTSLVEKFVNILEDKEDVAPDILTEILSSLYNEKSNLSDEVLEALSDSSINDWMNDMSQNFTADQEDRKIGKLVDLVRGNANTSEGIVDKLPGIQKSVEDMYKEEFPVVSEFLDSIIDSDQLESQQSYEELLYTYRSEITGDEHSIQQAYVKMLSLIDRAIELKRGFKLRDTQKLSILALLANKRSTLAQVSTGEGKSLIVVAASIIMIALPGDNKVDIITSSSSLAKRDAEDNKDIYNLFGIDVSHNCNEDVEKRREAYSSNQVVYGDLSSFQRDYLLHRFYEKNILGDRNLGNVIVDEVDSMLLDKGNNMLYLSHDLAGFDKLESVYLYIWQWVNSPALITEEFATAFDAASIKDAVLNDLHGRIAKEDIQKLSSELEEQHTKMIWESLIDAKILDDQGMILKQDISASELIVLLSPQFIGYEDRLCYMIRERIGRRRFIQVPNYLLPFIEQHLESWINSAIMAVAMKQGHDYVLDVDRTGTSPDLNPNVTILDRDTGTDQASSQWDEALHQFLQLKHGCKLSLQSLKAVFISNVRYLKQYRRLYGLTGTLGSHRERDLLREIHEVDFVTIPRSKPRQFQEKMPIFCSDRTKWIEQVFTEATKFTNELKRSVLIICETIDDVETFQRHFKRRDTNHVYTYTRDYEKFDIAEGSEGLGQGQIMIATNLSGRGTDIKITKELEGAGGLHVCLTYLPDNSRIEQQAFGRAARNGNKGSGRLIVMGSKRQAADSDAKILDLKKQRDAEELRRISEIKAHYETQIIREEYFFEKFKCQYERLKKNLADNGPSTGVQKILLQSCLDKWAFWLDRNSKCMKNLTNDQTEKYSEDSLNKFISHLKILKYEKSHWLPWVDEYPVQMIKLGKQLCQERIYDDAIKLFDKAIERELYFSEAAHYYKAYALIKRIDWAKKPLDKKSVKELKMELREAARLFDERRDFSICAGAIINNIKQHDNKSIIQIDAYAEQQESLSNFYYLFSQSIGKVFGPLVTPDSFVNDLIGAELSEVLYEDLLRHNILKGPKVRGNASEDSLRRISIDYGIPAERLSDLLATFRGKEIDEKKFRKTIKEGLKLASREDFWQLLIEHNILNREINCVVVHVNRLKDADPTLFEAPRKEIFKFKLQRHTLKCRRNEILLNALPAGDQNDYIIFEKNTFKSLIDVNDRKKYAFLKNKEIFTSNKKASINLTKIAETALPRYDSITLEDFSEENIATNEAVKILSELYDQKVITQKDSKSCVYRLKIPCSELEKIKLPSFPLYEDTVKSLLSLRFAYRVALEKIEKQIRDNCPPVHPRLTNKPHYNVICELLDQRMIRLAKVNVKVIDLKKQLSNIYSPVISRNDLGSMLTQNGLITTEANSNALRDHLVEKLWLRVISPVKGSPSDPDCKFGINDPDKREILDTTVVAYDVRVKIERALDNRFQLANENTIAHIIKILDRSKSMLKSLEFPDSHLKSLTECSAQGEFQHVGEIDMLTLNGLTHLLQVSEKKWTRGMLCNSVAVVMMGMCQIAISYLLNMYRQTLLADGLFFEGFSDVLFALKSLGSGHFQWKDYVSYKTRNGNSELIGCGYDFILSKLSNRSATPKSHFGNRITGYLREIATTAVESVLNSLTTAKTNGAGEAGERVAWKVAAGGIEFGMAHVKLDAVIEHQLKILCNSIESSMLSNIENEVKEVRNYDNFVILEEMYLKMGKDFAMKTINHLIQRSVTEQSFREKMTDIAAPIVYSVMKDITQATEDMQRTSTSIHTSPIQDIHNVLAGVSQPVSTGTVQKITRDILEDLLDNLRDQYQLMLNNQQLEGYAKPKFPEQEQKAVQERKIFNNQVVRQWKSLLLNAAGPVIKQQIVDPIFDEGCDHLIGYSKKMMNIKFRSCRRDRNKERFEELRKQYPVLLPHCDLPNIEHYTAVNEYHENLRKLANKTRNRKLFAEIIRESSPMDLNCLDICTRVIQNMLGIGVIVRVKDGSSSGKRNVSSNDGLVDGRIIELVLTDTCFNIECLHGALSHQRLLPAEMTVERFRNEVADRIEQDPDIKYHIEQDWPKVSTHSPSFDSRHQIKMVTDELWTDVIDENAKLLQYSMRHGRNKELNKHVEESSPGYSNENETLREDRWTSLDCGLSSPSRDSTIEERQGNCESLKIAAQQIRELNLNFTGLSRNRRPPSGRSKSLERLASAATQSMNCIENVFPSRPAIHSTN